MNTLIIIVAKYLIFAMVLAAFIWWLRSGKDKWKILILAVAAGILALIIAKVSSYFIYDPRPFTEGLVPLFAHADDNGFPSDHTLLAAVIAFVVLAYNRVWGGILLVCALAVGLARVMANVHHVTDIVGSLVIAAVATFIVWVIIKAWTKRRGVVSTENTTR